jgi:hypothetical protein
VAQEELYLISTHRVFGRGYSGTAPRPRQPTIDPGSVRRFLEVCPTRGRYRSTRPIPEVLLKILARLNTRGLLA